MTKNPMLKKIYILILGLFLSGISIFARNTVDTTDYYKLAQTGTAKEIVDAFKRNPDLSKQVFGLQRETFLMMILHYDRDLEIVKKVLQGECSVNAVTEDQKTPVIYAAQYTSHPEVLEYVIKAGTLFGLGTKSRVTKIDNHGMTAFDYARQNPTPGLIEILEKYGKEPSEDKKDKANKDKQLYGYINTDKSGTTSVSLGEGKTVKEEDKKPKEPEPEETKQEPQVTTQEPENIEPEPEYKEPEPEYIEPEPEYTEPEPEYIEPEPEYTEPEPEYIEPEPEYTEPEPEYIEPEPEYIEPEPEYTEPEPEDTEPEPEYIEPEPEYTEPEPEYIEPEPEYTEPEPEYTEPEPEYIEPEPETLVLESVEEEELEPIVIIQPEPEPQPEPEHIEPEPKYIEPEPEPLVLETVEEDELEPVVLIKPEPEPQPEPEYSEPEPKYIEPEPQPKAEPVKELAEVKEPVVQEEKKPEPVIKKTEPVALVSVAEPKEKPKTERPKETIYDYIEEESIEPESTEKPAGIKDSADEYGVTQLMRAAMAGNDWQVRTLIESRADVNARDIDGWTALMYACRYQQNVQIVKNLIENGAYVRVRNKYNVTPLLMAAEYSQNPEILSVLLTDRSAADEEVFKAFILTLSSTQTSTEITKSKLELFLEKGVAINRIWKGKTPLMYACQYSTSTEIIQLLLDQGAKTTIRDSSGKTAFDYAKENRALEHDSTYWILNGGQ